MLKLSASQIKTYMQCRQQYYDKYRLKLPRKNDTSGLLGTAVHAAIDKFYTESAPPIKTFMSTVRDTLTEWQDSGTEVNYFYNQAEIFEMGSEILKSFDFSQFTPRATEIPFDLPFYNYGTMRGFIDMITDDGGIVDFKTSKYKPRDLNKDPQFLIYPWAYFQMYGELPKYVQWYHLRTHQRFDFVFDWGRFDAIVVNTVKEMSVDDFSDLDGSRCTKCAFWCPRYNQGKV